MIRFTTPLWLLLLLPAWWSWTQWRRYLQAPGVPRIVRTVALLRTGALLCLVLALMGTQWLAKQRGVDLILAVDMSESVTPVDRDLSLDVARAVARHLGHRDRVGLIAFAREAYIDQPLGAQIAQLQRIEATPNTSGTNLQAALQLAVDMAETDRNVRVLVVSDGVSNRGDAESLLPLLQERRVVVDALLLTATPAVEVSLDRVIAPTRVGQKQPFSIRAVAISTHPTVGRLRLFRDDTLVADRPIELQEGRNVFDFPGLRESPGVIKYTVHVEASEDTSVQNNVGYASISVTGPSRTLVVTESTVASASLISALRGQGMLVDVVGPQALPSNASTLSTYGALLLHDVTAVRLSASQLTQIASYVRNLGGGLVTIGGHSSYGLGGYYKTALAEVLPVNVDVRDTLAMPSLAIVLILDKSGSMAGNQSGMSKIDLAKEAALGVLDVVSDRDLFGVIAFDSEPVWIVPVQQAIHRPLIIEQIGTLTADGGTDMGPAIAEAQRVLTQSHAMVKHAIILSDGQSADYDFESVTASLRSAGVTVSTVAIGRDADRLLLTQIANWGGGRSYYSEDAQSIPRIFITEAFMVSRPLAVEERFRPHPHQAASFLSGINMAALPALDGYVLTTPKKTAAVHLMTNDQNPILASWRHGLGRVVSFTSGATTTWAADWLRWAGFGSFWSQVVRWVTRQDGASPLRTSFQIHEGRGLLVVDAIDANGQFVDFLHPRAEVVAPSGDRHTVLLQQTAPGQYVGELEASEEGVWLAAIADPSHPGLQEPTLIGTVFPYSPEYRQTGLDTGTLERIVSSTGGTVLRGPRLPEPNELRSLLRHPRPIRTAVAMRPMLLVLAFLLFLVDIALRYLPRDVVTRLQNNLLPWLVDPDLPEDSSAVEVTGLLRSKAKPRTLRLEDIVKTRRSVDLAPRSDLARSADPAMAAARYLAFRRRRATTGSTDKDQVHNVEDESDKNHQHAHTR